MIIAVGTGDQHDQRTILLGVTRANLAAVIAGRPIHLHAEAYPGFPEDLELVIAFGETDRELVASVLRAVNESAAVTVIAPPAPAAM
jgi:hypothetical protein